MSLEVRLHEGESQDSLLRRFQRMIFQRMIQMGVILRAVKANRHFVPKGEAARIRAKNNTRRRWRQGNA